MDYNAPGNLAPVITSGDIALPESVAAEIPAESSTVEDISSDNVEPADAVPAPQPVPPAD